MNHCNDILKLESIKVNLSQCDIDKNVLIELSNELSQRTLIIEELNLSNLACIDTTMIEILSKNLFKQNRNGISSNVNKIILDDNNITQVDLFNLVDNAAHNTLLRHISVKNCKIKYENENEQ